MFDHINVDPEFIEFVLAYWVPAVVGIVVTALGLLGLLHVVEKAVTVWRAFKPLVDQESDPAIIALARALHMSPAQVVAIFKALGDQIDPSAPPPTLADEAAK